jgi:ABC-type bacteriocin/lantibiotic exporter with double-glycine peptidase domain
MTLPVVLEIHVMKGGHDCGVAALATISGIPYRTVSAKAIKMYPTVHKEGLSTPEMIAIAKALGLILEPADHPDLDDADETGLMQVSKSNGGYHWVAMFQGVVINPSDGLLYDYSTYLKTRKYLVRDFLAPRSKKQLPKNK